MAERITSDPKIRQIPSSTERDKVLGTVIVWRHLGNTFKLEWGFPRNVGVKGDRGVWGETVAVTSSNQEDLVRLHDDSEQNPTRARVSTALTNGLNAVTRVLVDVEAQPESQIGLPVPLELPYSSVALMRAEALAQQPPIATP